MHMSVLSFFASLSSFSLPQRQALAPCSATDPDPVLDSVLSPAESRAIFKLHYEEISLYLDGRTANGSYLHYPSREARLKDSIAEPANFRAPAREPINRLTNEQFHELSTDVYDELLRRRNEATGPGKGDYP